MKKEVKINYLEKVNGKGVKVYGGMEVQSNSLLLSGLASRLSQLPPWIKRSERMNWEDEQIPDSSSALRKI